MPQSPPSLRTWTGTRTEEHRSCGPGISARRLGGTSARGTCCAASTAAAQFRRHHTLLQGPGGARRLHNAAGTSGPARLQGLRMGHRKLPCVPEAALDLVQQHRHPDTFNRTGLLLLGGSQTTCSTPTRAYIHRPVASSNRFHCAALTWCSRTKFINSTGSAARRVPPGCSTGYI